MPAIPSGCSTTTLRSQNSSDGWTTSCRTRWPRQPSRRTWAGPEASRCQIRHCYFNGVTPERRHQVTDVTISEARQAVELSPADEQLLRELTERARTGGLKLTGEGGLLGKLTKMVIEGDLEGAPDGMGHEKDDPIGRDGGKSRNGHRAKTVLTDTEVPKQTAAPRT